ncbi:MAG: mechanosensitive ion channel, partial [Ignavibacteriae bacterium]|nr:mechanosensitive ion channel [Ignavibacteriota bacterium]
MDIKDLNHYLEMGIDGAVSFAPKVLAAVAIVMIGFWVIKKVMLLLGNMLKRVKFDEAVSSFIISFIQITLKIILVLVAAGVVGFELAGLMGIMAGMAFAVGLALQGSLSIFAAGILVLIFKPYKIGDWVEIQDKFGQVEEIQIFSTVIVTPGNKTMIIPNGQVIEGTVTNLSKKEFIRLELNVTMPYAESFTKVEKIIRDVLDSIPTINKKLVAEVGIETYDSHSIVVAVRP